MKAARFLMVAVLLVFGLAGAAQAGNVANVKFPISGVVSDLCTGENVQYTGTAHFVINTSTNAAGDVKLIANVEYHVKGVGLTSGADYVGNETDKSRYVIDATGCPASFKDTAFFRLIGKGPVTNEQLRLDFQFNLDASCAPTANFNFSVVCPG